MVKKAVSLTALLFFSWLQTYQFSDMGEDTVEAFAACATTFSRPHSTGTTVSLPDNDFDAAIPLVVGQALGPGRMDWTLTSTTWHSVSFEHPVALALLSEPQINVRSPPSESGSFIFLRVSSIVLDRLTARPLAPPAA